MSDLTTTPPGARGGRTGGVAGKAWRIAGGQTLKWRDWGGDYVVFNPLSGQTHCLDIVTGRILTQLMARAGDIHEIRSAIAAFLEVEDNEMLASTIEDIATRLENAGLIEPAD